MLKKILMATALFALSTNVALADSWHGRDHGRRDRDRHYDHRDYRHHDRSRTVLSFNFGYPGYSYYAPYGYHRPYSYYRPAQYYPQPVYINPQQVVMGREVQVSDNDQYCREYQSKARVGGQWQDTYGTACYQPDGSWQIVQD